MDEENQIVETDKEKFTITFSNGALTRLKKVATDLGIPETDLKDVLIKGIVLIDEGKEGNFITLKKGGSEYRVDLRTL